MSEITLITISIVLLAIVFGTIGFFIATIFLHAKSRTFRKEFGLPNILGAWHCRWFDDEGDPTIPKVEDTLEIQKWVRNGEFSAIGHQPQFHLNYPVSGEIDPSRIVTLEYRAAKYPYETNRGVVCLVLARDGQKMEGKWFGRRSTGNLGGGRVICTRVGGTAT